MHFNRMSQLLQEMEPRGVRSRFEITHRMPQTSLCNPAALSPQSFVDYGGERFEFLWPQTAEGFLRAAALQRNPEFPLFPTWSPFSYPWSFG